MQYHSPPGCKYTGRDIHETVAEESFRPGKLVGREPRGPDRKREGVQQPLGAHRSEYDQKTTCHP